jgi:hypothetical protein
MPGRFPLAAVALIGDAFCEGGFCEDSGPADGGLIVPPNGPAWGLLLGVATLCTGQTVQWLRNGVSIAGATGTTYTLGDNDMGRNIAAAITCPGGETTTTDSVNGGTDVLDPDDYPGVTLVIFQLTYTQADINTVPCTEQFFVVNASGTTLGSRFPIGNHAGRIAVTVTGIGIDTNIPLQVSRYLSLITRFRDGVDLVNSFVQSNCGTTLNSKHKLWVKPFD